MLEAGLRSEEPDGLSLFVASDGGEDVGYAWLRPVVTARRTGEDVGPMSELVYINVLLDDGAAHPAIVRALFCAVLWHVIMLSATGMVRGLVMEADHSGVDRTLRHRPEVATLREYPFFHVLRASDFAAIDHMFCDRLKSGHAISAH